jgi:beta-glucosidase
MALIDNNGECILEPGRFTVYAGGSQPDRRSFELIGRMPLNASFEVTGETVKLKY